MKASTPTMRNLSQRLNAEGGTKANRLVLLCCGILGLVWIGTHLLVLSEDICRYGVAVGDPMFVTVQLVTYTFVHARGWLLVVNLVMLVLVGEVLAHCLSVRTFVRVYSLASVLGGLTYWWISRHTGNQVPLCGAHPVLMSWCTSMLVMNPGRKVGENVRGPLLVLGTVFFFVGMLADGNNEEANALAMTAGAVAGFVYGVAARFLERRRV
jgi:membrane associated rhomboid family serine protease